MLQLGNNILTYVNYLKLLGGASVNSEEGIAEQNSVVKRGCRWFLCFPIFSLGMVCTSKSAKCVLNVCLEEASRREKNQVLQKEIIFYRFLWNKHLLYNVSFFRFYVYWDDHTNLIQKHPDAAILLIVF